MPELDTLRGVAVLMVVCYHGLGWRYAAFPHDRLSALALHATLIGWAGVNLFFVLSGFLITGILLDTRGRSDFYSRFYRCRALRILPIYLITVLVMLAAHAMSITGALFSLVFLANLVTLFGISLPHSVLWTLAVEEQFYLGWPMVVRRASPRSVAVIAFCVVLAMPIIRALGYYLGAGPGLAKYTWFIADGLALGALLGVIARRPRGTDRIAVQWFAVACAGCAALIFILFRDAGLLTRSRSIVGAAFGLTMINFGFGAVVATALLLGTSRRHAWVEWRVLAFFGAISYGLYLIHVFVYDLLYPTAGQAPIPTAQILERFLIATTLAVAIASLSRWQFEARFLRLKEHRHSHIPAAQRDLLSSPD
jgi:peptidoglycan/LPS O-acetylase OafA/YrhL